MDIDFTMFYNKLTLLKGQMYGRGGTIRDPNLKDSHSSIIIS